MTVTLRRGHPDDAPELGRICHAAFSALANAHNFPPDFPNAEVATGVVRGMLGNSGFFGVVAEADGKIAGSNFLDERNSISGVGPIVAAAILGHSGDVPRFASRHHYASYNGTAPIDASSTLIPK